MTDPVLPDVVVSSPERFVDEAAAEIAAAIVDSIAARGGCRIALAGGGTPKPIYEALAEREDVEWRRVRFFWGDERAVGPEHDASNYRMVRETLLDPIGATDDQAFRIRGEDDPEQAASDYERRLGDAPLDLVLLGMGGDGHTASLFPGDPGVDETERRVVVTTSPVEPTTRISLTFRAIDEAHRVVLLVAGGGKADRLAEIWQQIASGRRTLPAARIAPGPGRLQWRLDEPAASKLPTKGTP